MKAQPSLPQYQSSLSPQIILRLVGEHLIRILLEISNSNEHHPELRPEDIKKFTDHLKGLPKASLAEYIKQAIRALNPEAQLPADIAMLNINVLAQQVFVLWLGTLFNRAVAADTQQESLVNYLAQAENSKLARICLKNSNFFAMREHVFRLSNFLDVERIQVNENELDNITASFVPVISRLQYQRDQASRQRDESKAQAANATADNSTATTDDSAPLQVDVAKHKSCLLLEAFAYYQLARISSFRFDMNKRKANQAQPQEAEKPDPSLVAISQQTSECLTMAKQLLDQADMLAARQDPEEPNTEWFWSLGATGLSQSFGFQDLKGAIEHLEGLDLCKAQTRRHH